MSSDDFIEGDVFDPEVAIAEEEARASVVEVSGDAVRAQMARRQNAYANVFSEGPTDASDLEYVLLDLAHFCRAYSPTFHATNQKIQDLQEGRREVHQRIMDSTRLSVDTLFVKYSNATTLR